MLWGNMIDLVLVTYMPVTTALFIGLVGLQWEDETNLLGQNFWNVFMLYTWLLCPLLFMVLLCKNREHIGAPREKAQEHKDRMQVEIKEEIIHARELLKIGLHPEGLISYCSKKAAAKKVEGALEGVQKSQKEPPLHKLSQEEEDIKLLSENHADLELLETKPQRNNAWKICGRAIPAWVIPRVRNKIHKLANGLLVSKPATKEDHQDANDIHRSDETWLLPTN